jgi:hypothetical protein
MLARNLDACKRLIKALRREGIKLKLLNTGSIEIVGDFKRLTARNKKLLNLDCLADYLKGACRDVPSEDLKLEAWMLKRMEGYERAAFNPEPEPQELFEMALSTTPLSTPLIRARVFGLAQREAKKSS